MVENNNTDENKKIVLTKSDLANNGDIDIKNDDNVVEIEKKDDTPKEDDVEDVEAKPDEEKQEGVEDIENKPDDEKEDGTEDVEAKPDEEKQEGVEEISYSFKEMVAAMKEFINSNIYVKRYALNMVKEDRRVVIYQGSINSTFAVLYPEGRCRFTRTSFFRAMKNLPPDHILNVYFKDYTLVR